MAATRTVTIGPGRDKPSLAQAIADESYKDPTTDNGNGGPGLLVYECYNLSGGAAETPSAVIDVSGYTCDASNYLIVRAAQSELNAANRGIYATDRYRIEPQTNISGLRVSSAYVRLEDIQVKLTVSASGSTIYAVGFTAGNARADRCIAQGNITGTGNTGNYIGFSGSAAGNPGAKLVNCLAFDFWDATKSESKGYGFLAGPTGHHLNAYNCTAVRCYRTYFYTDGHMNCYNCGASDYSGNSGYTWENSLTGSPAFKNSGAHDYHLTEGDTVWKRKGADYSGQGYSDDLDGEPRIGLWDVGSDQYLAPRNPVAMDFGLE